MTQPAQSSGHEYTPTDGKKECTCGWQFDMHDTTPVQKQWQAHVASVEQAAQPQEVPAPGGTDEQMWMAYQSAQIRVHFNEHDDTIHWTKCRAPSCIEMRELTIPQPASAAKPAVKSDFLPAMFTHDRMFSESPAQPQLLGAQKHLEICAACNHGRTPCSEYILNYAPVAAQPPTEELEAQLADILRVRYSHTQYDKRLITSLAAFIRTHQAARERELLEKLEELAEATDDLLNTMLNSRTYAQRERVAKAIEAARALIAEQREGLEEPMTQPAQSSGHEFPWAMETMQMINKMTPDIQGKALDPDWFQLRNRLEEFERAYVASIAQAAPLTPYGEALHEAVSVPCEQKSREELLRKEGK